MWEWIKFLSSFKMQHICERTSTHTLIPGVIKQDSARMFCLCISDEREQRGAEGRRERWSGRCSVLPWGPAPPGCPLKTEFLRKLFVSFSLTPPGCCSPQHKTVTPRPSSLSLSLSLPPFCRGFTLFRLHSQHVAHVALTSQDDPSPEELGSSVNHAPLFFFLPRPASPLSLSLS